MDLKNITTKWFITADKLNDFLKQNEVEMTENLERIHEMYRCDDEIILDESRIVSLAIMYVQNSKLVQKPTEKLIEATVQALNLLSETEVYVEWFEKNIRPKYPSGSMKLGNLFMTMPICVRMTVIDVSNGEILATDFGETCNYELLENAKVDRYVRDGEFCTVYVNLLN